MPTATVNALIANAAATINTLRDVIDNLHFYQRELTRNGTDSLAADDYLALIRKDEMIIQQFTNAVDDIALDAALEAWEPEEEPTFEPKPMTIDEVEDHPKGHK